MVVLSACGGGGGGGGGNGTAAPPPPADTLGISTIVTQIPVANYAPGSEALSAFTLLNSERSTCGFGLLAQSTQLDNAAGNHAKYLVVNSQQGQYETSGMPSFTGVDPAYRVLWAGYLASSTSAYGQPSEAATIVPSTNVLAGAGRGATRVLMAAPYHLIDMFRGYRDVGASAVLASTWPPAANYAVHVFNFATPAAWSPQLPGARDVLTYPCQGSTGINYQLAADEIPSPVQNRNLISVPVGHPIMIAVRNGQTLTITSSNLIKVSTGAAVALRAPYTKATDPTNSAYLYANEGFVLPDVPLEPSTQYQATITGTNDDIAFSRIFTFWTGTGG